MAYKTGWLKKVINGVSTKIFSFAHVKTVYTDYENGKLLSDKLTEIDDDIAELNSNLSDLAYGERSGNKNLLDVSKIKGMSGVVKYGDYGFINTITDTRTKSVPYINLYDGNTLVAGGKSLTKTPSSGIVKAYETFTIAQPINRASIGHSGAVNNCSVLFNMNLPAGTYTISMDIVKDNPNIVGGFEFKNIQIEEGTTATPYKPYIPSVKMLASENAQQNTESMDLKMLGWTVPEEMSINNYVDSDGVFHQRVDRVDMSDLSWDFNSEKVQWATTSLGNIIKRSTDDNTPMPNVYSRNQPIVKSANKVWAGEEGIGVGSTGVIYYKDSNTSSTNKPTGYLYFELATEITMNVDGNEAVTQIKNDLDDAFSSYEGLVSYSGQVESTQLDFSNSPRNYKFIVIGVKGVRGDGMYTFDTKVIPSCMFANLNFLYLNNKAVKVRYYDGKLLLSNTGDTLVYVCGIK